MFSKILFTSLWILVSSYAFGIQAEGPHAERSIQDYRKMYTGYSPSIVRIDADAGHGSGFLINSNGLIATNHHVVANVRFLAVKLFNGPRIPAKVVRLSPQFDLALLKIHASKVVGREPLELLPEEEEDEVRAGLPVVAFGSPLSQRFLITQGIISKVEPLTIVGDYLLEPGNSGGPLLNSEGKVVGVNTFKQGGISGSVRVHLLRELIAQVSEVELEEIGVSAGELPEIRKQRFPADQLKEKSLQRSEFKSDKYEFESGDYTVKAYTPVRMMREGLAPMLKRAENRYKRRGKELADSDYQTLYVDPFFYEWRRLVDSNLDIAITFVVVPDIGKTGGSLLTSSILAGLAGFSAGMASSSYGSGNYLSGSSWTQAASNFGFASRFEELEFKGEFYDLRIYRDGELIQPITPGRAVVPGTVTGPMSRFVDEAYMGIYTFDPAEFMTGRRFRFVIFDAEEPEKAHKSKTLDEDSDMVRMIRSDFEGVIEDTRRQ